MESDEFKHTIIKKKWLIVSILMVVVLTVLFVISTQIEKSNSPISKFQSLFPSPGSGSISEIPVLSQSEELKKAIAEQSNVDSEYAAWKDNNQQAYPWINKMPLTSDKYYVYFDLNKKVFVATIYPGIDGDVEQIKATVLNDLKNVKGVAVENFTFEWIVYRIAQ